MKTIKLQPIQSSAALLLLVLTLLAWIIRCALIINVGDGWNVIDINGFASDITTSMFITIIFILLRRLHIIPAAVFIILIFMMQLGNYEHVLANGDTVSLRFAGQLFDPTFFKGSATTLSNKVLVAFLLFSVVALFFLKKIAIQKRTMVLLSLLFVVTLPARYLFTTILDARWRTYNVLHSNGEDLFFSFFTKKQSATKGLVFEKNGELLTQDLSGTPILPRGSKTTNILLIIVESGCGSMLPSLQKYQGISSKIIMPHLDSIARCNTVYPNFITHQRQTNRGTFCLLLGTYPKLDFSTPKMTEYVIRKTMLHDSDQIFLPSFLRRKGYNTTYIQGAPLTYMLKDKFMPIAGFKQSYGREYFKHWNSDNYWGVDDKAFFDQAFDIIVSKKKKTGPQFYALLNVGTHHPMNVPDTYGNPKKESVVQRAFKYCDESLNTFIHKLDSSGFLDNTLTIITCDESQGIKDPGKDFSNLRLLQQWGFCIVIQPKIREPQVITEIVSQADIALSIADYCGFDAQKAPFIGRSIFRHYGTRRSLFFANTYTHLTGCFSKDNTLLLSDRNFTIGECFSYDPQRIFSPSGLKTLRKIKREELEYMAGFNAFSNSSVINQESWKTRPHHLNFTPRSPFLITAADYQKTLLDGQFFTLPKNCHVQVQLRGYIVNKDSCPDTLFLKHDLASQCGKDRITYYMPATITSGDTFNANYSFYNTVNFNATEFRFTAEIMKGDSAVLAIEAARISYTPRTATPAEEVAYTKKKHNKKQGVYCGEMQIIPVPLVPDSIAEATSPK